MASNDPRPTKAERREAARAKAQALREEQARKAHRAAITRRAAIGVGGVAVVGGIGGLIWKSKSSEGDDENGQEKAPDLNTEKGSLVPSSVDPENGALTYGSDLKVGTSNEGAPVLDIYFDYSCPHCAEFEALHSAEMKSLVTDGKVTLVLHPAHVLKLKWTIWAYSAMGVVLDKEPDKALDLHTALFSRFEQAAAKRDVTLLQKKGIWETASGTGLSSWDFCMRALEEAHVALTPGLDFATATGSTHVRLSYAASREELATGLERLGAFLRGLG